MNLGANLKKFREQAGFTRKAAAEKLGVSLSAITHWENNDNEISDEYLLKMKALYNVTIAEMYDEVPNIPLDKDTQDSLLEKVLDLCDLNDAKTMDELDINDQMMIKAVINKLIDKKKGSTN